jgi:hypothetical protein
LGLGTGAEFIAAARGQGAGGALASLACLGVKWGGEKLRERCAVVEEEKATTGKKQGKGKQSSLGISG